jgi:hypothetical protein
MLCFSYRVKILDATIPKEFIGMYAPRTIYDVIMLVVDLMRAAIQNPKLIDGKIPSELIRYSRVTVVKPSKSPIISQKDLEVAPKLPRKTEISITSAVTTPRGKRPTEFTAEVAQRTKLMTAQQLPPIKSEGHFRKSNIDDMKQSSTVLKLRSPKIDGTELVERSKAHDNVFVTDRSKARISISGNNEDEDDEDHSCDDSDDSSEDGK